MTLPHSPARTQQELVLQTLFGPALAATKGHAAPETGHAYARARELCQQVGDTPGSSQCCGDCGCFIMCVRNTRRRWNWDSSSSPWRNAYKTSALLAPAHRMLGTTLYCLGELRLAHSHLEQGRALTAPHQHRSLVFLYGTDIGVGCPSVAAWALWMLGYPEQALQGVHEALTLAQELSHPYSLGLALGCAMPAPSVSAGRGRRSKNGSRKCVCTRPSKDLHSG